MPATAAASVALNASDRLWDRDLWSQGLGNDVACLISQAITHLDVFDAVAHRVGLCSDSHPLDVASAVADVAIYRANMGRGEPTPADVLREFVS